MFILDEAEDSDMNSNDEDYDDENEMNDFINDDEDSENSGNENNIVIIRGGGRGGGGGGSEIENNANLEDIDDEYMQNSSKVVDNGASERSSHNIGGLRVIASSAENLISFQIPYVHGKGISIRFLDSYRFLSEPLSKLASLLDKSEMSSVRKCYPLDEDFDLASRKGVFPYEHISEFSKYDETSLPSKDSFYSSLTCEHISDEEYNFAQKVWRVFKCHTLGDYSRGVNRNRN